MADLPATPPVVDPESAPFWAATEEGRLLLGRCTTCDAVFFPPRDLCPVCHRPGSGTVDAAGTGTVHGCSVVRRGMGAFRDAGPYVLAYVALDEGPRLLTNVVGADPEEVAIGDRVRVVFVPTPEGPALYRFEPERP